MLLVQLLLRYQFICKAYLGIDHNLVFSWKLSGLCRSSAPLLPTNSVDEPEKGSVASIVGVLTKRSCPLKPWRRRRLNYENAHQEIIFRHPGKASSAVLRRIDSL